MKAEEGITGVLVSWVNAGAVLFVGVGFASVFPFFGFGLFFHHLFRPCSGGSLLPPKKHRIQVESAAPNLLENGLLEM